MKESSPFDLMVQEAVDKALSVLGEGAKKAVYYYVETYYGLRKEEIPKNLEKFHEALHLLFGVGTYALERHISHCIEERFKVKLPRDEDFDLAEFVEKVKAIYK
ncbi:MAG: hypothetical protein QXJ17_02635 [Nitrososphaeria archaeon]